MYVYAVGALVTFLPQTLTSIVLQNCRRIRRDVCDVNFVIDCRARINHHLRKSVIFEPSKKYFYLVASLLGGGWGVAHVHPCITVSPFTCGIVNTCVLHALCTPITCYVEPVFSRAHIFHCVTSMSNSHN